MYIPYGEIERTRLKAMGILLEKFVKALAKTRTFADYKEQNSPIRHSSFKAKMIFKNLYF
jgi:hypothetical protein